MSFTKLKRQNLKGTSLHALDLRERGKHIADGGESRREGDGSEGGAATKGTFADGGESRREGDGSERGAVTKATSPMEVRVGERVMEARERSSAKGTIADAGESRREGDGGEGGTVTKGTCRRR